MEDAYSDYFRMYRSMVGNLSGQFQAALHDDLHPDEEKESAGDKPSDETVSTVVHSAAVLQPRVKVVRNQYHGSETDSMLSSFEERIGEPTMTPGVLIIPPPSDLDSVGVADIVPVSAPVQAVESAENAVEDDVLIEEKGLSVDASEIDISTVSQTAVSDAKKSSSVSIGNKIAVSYKDTDIDLRVVKNVPAELVNRVSSHFPRARAVDAAITAYLYLMEGKPDDIALPDSVKELADTYEGAFVANTQVQAQSQSDVVGTIEQHMTSEMNRVKYSFENKFNALLRSLRTVELMMGYSLFDQLEFRKADAAEPSELDFDESGLAELMKHAAVAAEKKRKEELDAENRKY